MNEAIKTWPEKIYLRTGERDGSMGERDEIMDYIDWSDASINKGDLEYIRFDIVKERELELIDLTILRCMAQIENNRGLPDDDLFDFEKIDSNDILKIMEKL